MIIRHLLIGILVLGITSSLSAAYPVRATQDVLYDHSEIAFNDSSVLFIENAGQFGEGACFQLLGGGHTFEARRR